MLFWKASHKYIFQPLLTMGTYNREQKGAFIESG